MSIAGSATATCGPTCRSCRKTSSSRIGTGESPVRNVERLCRAHFWVAFGAFLIAAFLGTWQMWVRSPLGANIGTPGQYFISVTAHGVSMAYVMTTFFIMGFGYFVAVTALGRHLRGKPWAWLGFWMGFVGVLTALVPILMGHASVLYTFYPPLTGSPWFYIGLVLVVAGSWIWCVLMLVAMRAGSAKIQAGLCRWRCSRRWQTRCCGFGPRSAWRPNCCFKSSRRRWVSC